MYVLHASVRHNDRSTQSLTTGIARETRGCTGIGYLPLGRFRRAESSAFEWDSGWREIRPGWTVPQGSARLQKDALRPWLKLHLIFLGQHSAHVGESVVDLLHSAGPDAARLSAPLCKIDTRAISVITVATVRANVYVGPVRLCDVHFASYAPWAFGHLPQVFGKP